MSQKVDQEQYWANVQNLIEAAMNGVTDPYDVQAIMSSGTTAEKAEVLEYYGVTTEDLERVIADMDSVLAIPSPEIVWIKMLPPSM